MSTKDQTEIENAVVQQMVKFKHIPMEISYSLPKALDAKIATRWATTMDTKKKKCEKALVRTTSHFSYDQIQEYMLKYQ